MAKGKFEPLVAVDIGSFSLKFVFIVPNEESKPIVKALAHIRIPSFAHALSEEERSGMSKDDVEKDTIAKTNKFLTKYLTELLYDNQIQTKKGITLAGGRTATIRYIEIPPSPRDLLAANIKAEASKQMPFSIENAILGFTVLGETVREEKAVQQVAVAALQKDFVKVSTDHLKGGGLMNEGIITLPQALEIVFSRKINPPGGKSLKVGIIHCGHRSTSIMVYKNGSLNFFRDIPMAGEQITEAILAGGEIEGQKIVIANLEEAIQLKHSVGVLPPDELKKLSGKERFAGQQIFNFVEKIFQHIQLSISFYASQFGESGIDRVYLSGGSAAMKNFKDFIGESLEINAELINPFSELDMGKVNFPEDRLAEEGVALAASVGMAMYDGNPNVVNFIDIIQPNRGSQGVDVSKVSQKLSTGTASKFNFDFQLDDRKIKILAGLLGFLLLLVMAYPLLKVRQDIASIKKQKENLDNDLKSLQDTQSEVGLIIAEKEKLTKENGFTEVVENRGYPYSEILLELATSTPDFIYLVRFEITGTGEARNFKIAAHTENSDRVFEYLRILGNTHFLKSPVLSSTQEQMIDESHYYVAFEISGKVVVPVKQTVTNTDEEED
ncbi:MAG: pilus assembly protein PilM [Candidatus Riflebacteria bacterium]|nr:pilus assembly protein PilM [Candidatus Riflebacteria bacterium]